MGHAGTLDPLATGVLLVCIGRATKIAPYLVTEEKEYVARVRLGVTTDSLDAHGKVLEHRDVSVSIEDVRRALSSFVGDVEQIPPMFSAVKQGGTRLYHLARAGKTVERTPRTVHISCIELVDFGGDTFIMRVRCSKGTFVRSLAADIGDELGCGAHVADLVRTRVGTFSVDESLTVGEIERLAREGVLSERIVPLNIALGHLPEIRLKAEGRRLIEHGTPVGWKNVAVPVAWNGQPRTVRIVGSDDTLLGLGTVASAGATSPPDLRPIRLLV